MENRRVLAWVLLVGFVLLILNITFIGFYRTPSFIVYLVIAGYYLFSGKGKSNQGKSTEEKNIEKENSEEEKNNMG